MPSGKKRYTRARTRAGEQHGRDMPIAEREFKDSQEVELVTEVPLQDRE